MRTTVVALALVAAAAAACTQTTPPLAPPNSLTPPSGGVNPPPADAATILTAHAFIPSGEGKWLKPATNVEAVVARDTITLRYPSDGGVVTCTIELAGLETTLNELEGQTSRTKLLEHPGCK